MLETFSLRLRWMPYEKAMKDYPNGTYYTVGLGLCSVKTKDIIGLSLWPPEKLANDKKMLKLKESVKKNGWHDKTPRDLHLHLMPTGKYTVATGGNHRPILADKLGIPEITAYVDIVIPKSLLDTKTIDNIESLYERIRQLDKEAQDIRRFLDLQGANYQSKVKEIEFEEKCSLVDLCNENINSILMDQAHLHGLAPR